MPDDTMHEDKETEQPVTKPEPKRCGTCMWWLQAIVPEQQQGTWGKQEFNFGECRACPPTALPTNRTYESAGEVGQHRAKVTIKQARFPHVFDDDWCGMWTSRNSGE